jgi:hypothetical protein
MQDACRKGNGKPFQMIVENNKFSSDTAQVMGPVSATFV